MARHEQSELDDVPNQDVIDIVEAAANTMVRQIPSIKNERDDLAQEALVALWLDGVTEAHQPALVHTIARRRMIDYLRSVQGRRGSRRFRTWRDSTSLDAPTPGTQDLRLMDLVAHDERPYEHIEHDVTLARLRNTIEQMPDRQREVIQLRLLGLKLHEIGTRWGVTESRVGQVLRDARHRIMHRCPVPATKCDIHDDEKAISSADG